MSSNEKPPSTPLSVKISYILWTLMLFGVAAWGCAKLFGYDLK